MSYFDSIYSDNLPSRAVTLYMYLCHRANSDGQCWPSEKRIAKDLSMSLSTVKPNSVIEPKVATAPCNSESRVIPSTPRGNSCPLVGWGWCHIGLTKRTKQQNKRIQAEREQGFDQRFL